MNGSGVDVFEVPITDPGKKSKKGRLTLELYDGVWSTGSFLQSPQDYFGASPTFEQSYAPQFGEIFGILRQMRETFESNLSAPQKEEMENQKCISGLEAAKERRLLP